MNLRDGYLAYWSTGKDMGSTFVATERIFDTTTGITDIEAEEDIHGNNIYELSGRKVGKITTPGIYIINGKKVIVK